jgi:hypothetical protein
MEPRIVALAAALSMGAAVSAVAGQSNIAQHPGTCGVVDTETQFCRGTFAGVRANSDASSFVRFDMDSLALTFVIRLNGVLRGCSAPSSMKDVWMVAVGGAGFFHVEFDSEGRCTFALLERGSNVNNASAL